MSYGFNVHHVYVFMYKQNNTNLCVHFEMHQNSLAAGLCPRPHYREANSAPKLNLAGIKI